MCVKPKILRLKQKISLKKVFFVATEADNNFEVIMQGNFHLPQSPTRQLEISIDRNLATSKFPFAWSIYIEMEGP